MKISTNSWHYRLMDWMGFHIPNNLCPYCRKVIGAMLLLLLLAGFAALAVFAAASIVLHWFFPQLRGAAVIAGLFSIFMLAGALIESVKERKSRERMYAGEPMPERQPNIFVEWARAIHDKVCPILEFDR